MRGEPFDSFKQRQKSKKGSDIIPMNTMTANRLRSLVLHFSARDSTRQISRRQTEERKIENAIGKTRYLLLARSCVQRRKII